MKLHISVGQPDLAGFTNIDVGKFSIDLGKLDNVCEASECTEIIINDVLKYMPYNNIPKVLEHLCTRLRHNGILRLIFTDMNSVIREYNRGNVDEQLFNEILFQGSRSCFSYDYIVNIIKNININLKEIEISKEQVIIIAERP